MENIFSPKDKVVVITGGTGVLGSELARGLAKGGAKVVVLGRNPQKRDKVLQEIGEFKGEALGLLCDVLQEESLLAARAKIIEHFGTIDVLINGAGGNRKSATTSPELSFFNLPLEELEWVSRLNFTGTLLPSQIFGEVFAKKGQGVILNVSSMASFQPLTNVVSYSAA